ncbi:MAG: SDR family oxidoreductase [Nitrospirota bacterium]|nr:SDR family oxidoreductase [Nitrospirota bacterium]
MRVLVTGATGFIGKALLVRAAADTGLQVRGAFRQLSSSFPSGIETVVVGDLSRDTDWKTAVKGVDAVVHTAARVHIMHDSTSDPISEFRRINVEGTLNLARQASLSGVRRFIYLSSIKVNGERTTQDRPYAADDIPAPVDPYGITKLEAELGLRELGQKTGMEVVIIRPPLVYGPEVKANFYRLLRIVQKGYPLPLSRVNNQRSLIYLGNLIDAILTCLRHPRAAAQIYLVSDGEDISTPELIRKVASALECPARLLPFPPSVIGLAGKIAGKTDAVDRLLGSLRVDSTKIRRELGWSPPFTLEQGLKETAAWFKKQSYAHVEQMI